MKAALLTGSGLAVALALAAQAPAQQRPVSLEESFQIGSNALCTAQLLPADRAGDLFDRTYALVCRDASAPVGRLAVIRGTTESAIERVHHGDSGNCSPAARVAIDGLGEVQALRCAAEGSIQRITYLLPRGGSVYAAHGVAGYESALGIGLRTIALDRPVDAPVEIAVTEGSDAAAFARAQAVQLSPEAALAEAYRRSNAGDFAAAAEFFAAAEQADGPAASGAEAMLNAALQQSNLGNHARAEELFAQAVESVGTDPVLARMMRNYQAIHRLNLDDRAGAIELLSAALPAPEGFDPAGLRALEIDRGLAARLNAEGSGAAPLIAGTDALLPAERAEVLDGQAAQLRGTVYGLNGDPARARLELNQALERLGAVRGGRIGSVAWMRAQIMTELAAMAESDGDPAEAERLYRAAAELVATRYPASPALLSSQAQLASFLARAGREDEAIALYRSVVEIAQRTPAPGLKRLITPYFALLARRADRPEAVADMFQAGQALMRPGVAQTQAVLARELSAGSDAAAGLFRRSLNLAREVERTRIAVAALASEASQDAGAGLRLAELQQRLEALESLQVATQAELAQYPRYRAVSPAAIGLAELQGELREGEAYLKLIVLDDSSYALFLTRDAARAYPIGMSESEMNGIVSALRDSIVKVEDGQNVTYPFDVARSHELYGRLFGPVEREMAGIRHLVFEPDGAMLTLPLNLLVTSGDSVAAYAERANRPDGDPYDFTGLDWLGRRLDVTTAVSAGAFRDIRQARPSGAQRAYLGFGQNQPVDVTALPSATRSAAGGGSACQWPVSTWSRPISAAELLAARGSIARTGGNEGQVVTGEDFSDTSIRRMEGMDDYRVIHFATHGLVTAPRAECPALPALLTSFGPEESDGLLTFAEIFDLRLDADLVILSACDTAGGASIAATRAAGIMSGGGTAMDGLVRAFVGAGGRSVLASHWPVPDDFSATERLVTGLFTAPPGTSTAESLQIAQRALMDDPQTSHPYYWSAFAIVGDGAIPVIRTAAATQAVPPAIASLD
ncbi:CHAT domain-containing protein [Sphingosinicella sp. CPCC 101087]|uniref:CHAT domain-containing protein n=1 Tax=Sphingosinicella sp. CPCC 101087 TaxID=2497754 RepID=UPI00352AF72D